MKWGNIDFGFGDVLWLIGEIVKNKGKWIYL